MYTDSRSSRVSVALVLAAFCAGYLSNRTLVKKHEESRRLSERLGTIVSAQKAARDSGDEDEVRKGRLLSALLAASRDPDDLSRANRFQLVAAELGPHEIEAALDLTYRFSYYPRHGAIDILLARWAEFDPQAAAEYALVPRPVHPNQKSELLMQAMEAWGQKDFAAARAWAMSLKNPVQQQQAMAGVIDSIAQSDVPRAMAMVDDLPRGPLRDEAFGKVLRTWISQDAAAAAKFIASDRTRSPNDWTLMSATTAWAAKDAPAALAWAAQLPDAQARQVARMGVYSAMLKQDPAPVAAKMLRLPEAERDKTVSQIAEVATDSNPQSVIAFAFALPPGRVRDEAVMKGFRRWAGTEPETALGNLENWPNDLVSAQQKETMMSVVVQSWVSTNPSATVEWIDHLEDGHAKDWSLASAANAMAFDNPTGALAMQARIGDASRRETAMRQSYRAWSNRDAAAAHAWLNASDVPAEWKTAWITPPPAAAGK